MITLYFIIGSYLAGMFYAYSEQTFATNSKIERFGCSLIFIFLWLLVILYGLIKDNKINYKQEN